MLRILRTTLLNPNLTSAAAPKLFFLQIRFPLNTYCSFSETKRVNSERVVALFKGNGFSEDDITKLTRTCPEILVSDPQKTLTPKLDFFRSLGISNTDLRKIISSNPHLLRSSLKNQLIPCHHYLKSLLHSDENVVRVLKGYSWILSRSIDRILAPNFSLLSKIGVPELKIQYMLMRYTQAVDTSHTDFKSRVEEVISFGINPERYAFLDALRLLRVVGKTTIGRRWAAYRKGNLSDDEIRIAFRTFPNCMALSEERIRRAVDLFANKMGFKASKIISSPASVAYNLEKRTIPRCRVIKVLQSHGVLWKDIGLNTFLGISETEFLKKYVSKYEDKLPGLLKIYQGKMYWLETGTGSDNVDVTK